MPIGPYGGCAGYRGAPGGSESRRLGEVAQFPVDPKTLLEPSAELMASGKALFETNCTKVAMDPRVGETTEAVQSEFCARATLPVPMGWIMVITAPGI